MKVYGDNKYGAAGEKQFNIMYRFVHMGEYYAG